MILQVIASVMQQIAQGVPLWKISLPSAVHTDMSGLHGVQLLTFRNQDCLDRFDQIDTCDDPIFRIGLVIAGLIDPHTIFFVDKPFNPVLGEFIQCTSKDGRYTFTCEQVSHHPPVAGVNITGPSFKLHAPTGVTIDASQSIKPGFNKIDIEFPNCYLCVETKSGKYLYWQNFGYRIDGLIGTRGCYHFGPIEITDSSGLKFLGHLDRLNLEGKIVDKLDNVLHLVSGSLTHGVYLDDGRVWIEPVGDKPIEYVYEHQVLQDPMFSDNVWKDVLPYMRMEPKDFYNADKEKRKVEESQRARAKIGGYRPRYPQLVSKAEE